MAATVTNEREATPRERLAGVRGVAAKAELKAQVPATRLRDVAAEAMRRAMSQKAAALDMGISEGRLSHKVKDGSLTLAQLEALGGRFAQELGAACLESYGGEGAEARRARLIREARQKLDELAEAVAV